MRVLIISFVMFLLVTPVSNAISISHGGEAPDFTLTSVDGKTTSLHEHQDKVVVIIFWRTEQDRSLLALKDVKDLLDKYKDKGMQVLSIIEDSDDKEQAQKIFMENHFDYPLLVDSDRNVYGKYGVRVFPTTVIVDKEGTLLYDIPSHPLTYRTKLRGYIKKILGEIDEAELEEELSPHKEEKDKSYLEASRLYNLSLKFTEARLYDQAINTLKQSIDADPKMEQSYILAGFLYLETKEGDKALESFQQALELSPDSNDAKTGLGGALILKGEIDKAIEVLESAAVANPYPQMTYYELGKAFEIKGEKDKSIEMYKKAIAKIIEKKILPSSVSKCK